MVTEVHSDAVAISGELTELRRAIHREPEIGFELPRTQEKVLAALDGLPLEITTGRALTSVTAVLRGARPGQTVLLRGDMDALPVTERTGLAYASQVDGAMHACGHDLHTAMLAGAARLLSSRQPELSGNVIFMFQPGEEEGAGARVMISEGVLDAAGSRPVAAFGLHVASSLLPFGIYSARDGTMLAAADTLEITVHGHGGHGSQPHRADDPIPAACHIVTALQTLVTRRFDVFDPVVITVGSFHAGTASNVIPDEAELAVTVRSFSPAARAAVQDAALRLVRDIASAHGLSATAEFVDGYPLTVNPADPGPHHRVGGLLLRAGAGAGRVHHAGRLPAGRRPRHGPVQPRGRGGVRRRGAGRRRDAADRAGAAPLGRGLTGRRADGPRAGC